MNELTPRSTHASHIPVIKYEPKSRSGEVLAPRGSVVVYLAASGSQQLRAIHASARGRISKDVLLKDVDRVDKDGHLISLHYGDTILADKVRVPRDGTAVRLILPFIGGDLAAGELRVQPLEGESVVEAIAVRHDPPLSTIEQAALSLLPSDLLTVHLGAALPGGVAMDNDEERRRQADEQRRAADEARQEQAMQRAEAQADAAEARAEARQQRREGQGSLLEVHLLESTIKSLSSIQTAGAMINIRRQLLGAKV